ncbi:MAG: beta-ketoacyl-[acyl-carrier-protein] synthase family protein [Kiritimatiellia bacterium]
MRDWPRTGDAFRPVVTGIGVVAPNGIGVDAFWSALIEGRSGVVPITHFDASKLRTRIAGEVRGFEPRHHLPPDVKWRRMARHTQFALAAMEMALRDAGLTKADFATCPAFITMGVSTSAIEICEDTIDTCRLGHTDHLRPWLVWASQPNAVPVTLAEYLGAQLPSLAVSTACKAGLDALIEAVDIVRNGRAELVIAGGADAPITASTFASFDTTRMLSQRNDDPAHASRPFDRDRDGGIISEGAGVVVIESLAHARARGARVWLELCGGASRPDPCGSPDATGMSDAMTLALANASRRPEDIDYISAHGPSHPVIDGVESSGIRKVFGRHADRIPVSSIKGVIGNPLAAAGPLQAIACALSMRHDLIPPTANYTTPDPACDLDYVPQARRGRMHCALINVHGMGGGNSCVVVKRSEI